MTHEDLETMSIGMTLDYIEEYLDSKNPDRKNGKVVEFADEVPWL